MNARQVQLNALVTYFQTTACPTIAYFCLQKRPHLFLFLKILHSDGFKFFGREPMRKRTPMIDGLPTE